MTVIKLLAKIPRGRVTTYALLARAAGRPRAWRAVGNAVNKNPWPQKHPCHRVVKSNGSLGGYAHGAGQKIKILKQEGLEIKKGKIFNFSEKLYKF